MALAQKRRRLDELTSKDDDEKEEINEGYAGNLAQHIAAYKQKNRTPEKIEAKIKVLTDENEKEKGRALKRHMQDDNRICLFEKAEKDIQEYESVVSIYESARLKYFKADEEPDYSIESSESMPGWS